MNDEYLNRRSHNHGHLGNDEENNEKFRPGERVKLNGRPDEGKRDEDVSLLKHQSKNETSSSFMKQEKILNPYSRKRNHAIFDNVESEKYHDVPTNAFNCNETSNVKGGDRPSNNFEKIHQNCHSRPAGFGEQSLSSGRILNNPYKKHSNSITPSTEATLQSTIANPYNHCKDEKILHEKQVTKCSDVVALNQKSEERIFSTRILNPYTKKYVVQTKLSKNENSTVVENGCGEGYIPLKEPEANRLQNNTSLDRSCSLLAGHRNPYNLVNPDILEMELNTYSSEKKQIESKAICNPKSVASFHTIESENASKCNVDEIQIVANSKPSDPYKKNLEETQFDSFQITNPSYCETSHHEQIAKSLDTNDTKRPCNYDSGQNLESKPTHDTVGLPSKQKTTWCSNKPKLPPELEYDRARCLPINDEYRLKLIKAADLGGTLKNGWKLLPHQKVGILKAVQIRRLILAYDMGLGKTLIGCVFAKAFKETFPNLKVYVIAPVTLKKEWERTATDIVGLECEIEKKSANGILDQESLALRITSWSKVPVHVPPIVENYIVICDEAHHMQSMESARTKDTLKLVLAERCMGCLLLTGTPMKNGRPSNLFPLLRATRHPFGDDQKRYEFFFCNGQNKRYGNREVWDASGSSNLALLNAHITSHILYKTKDDCLNELPEKIREFKTVPVGSKYEIQHNQALNELVVIYNSYSVSNNDEGNDAILGAFARLRQIAAFAKIDATVALAKEILQTEPSVVIFTYYVSAAKELHKKLESAGWTGELLAGETPPAKRQKMIDNFQDGIKPVFIGTFGAAGVGITLTAARTIILMDRPWTPGDALQAEDRVRRIGQTKTVRSIWIRAFTIDEQIDSLIEHKSQNASSVVEKNSKRNDSSAAPRISIKKLVETILTENPITK